MQCLLTLRSSNNERLRKVISVHMQGDPLCNNVSVYAIHERGSESYKKSNLHESNSLPRSYNCYSGKVTSRLRLKCDGTSAETRFLLSAKRTSPFKSAGPSVQSTTGSRGVRISGSNAGYTMFRGSVKGTGYPLHSPVSPSLPHPCVTVCHNISTGLYYIFWACLCSLSYPAFVYAILSRTACPAVPYFTHYQLNGTICDKMLLSIKPVFDLLYDFLLKHFSFWDELRETRSYIFLYFVDRPS